MIGDAQGAAFVVVERGLGEGKWFPSPRPRNLAFDVQESRSNVATAWWVAIYGSFFSSSAFWPSGWNWR